MKKVITLILALSLMFSMLIIADAGVADASVAKASAAQKTNGELLFDLGIIKGSNGDLNESGLLTRAEMITILNRLNERNGDEPFVSPQAPTFSDVPKTHWAFVEVEKAYKNSITKGIGDGRFGVDDKVSYQQAVTFLVRVLKYDIDYDQALDTGKELGIALKSGKDKGEELLRSDIFELMTKALTTKVNNSNEKLISLIPTISPAAAETFFSYLAGNPKKSDTTELSEIYKFTASEDEYNGADADMKRASKLEHLYGVEIEKLAELFVGKNTKVEFHELYNSLELEEAIGFYYNWADYTNSADDGEWGEIGSTSVQINPDGSMQAFVAASEGQGFFSAKNPRVLKFEPIVIEGKDITPYYVVMDEETHDESIKHFIMFMLVDKDGIYKVACIGGYGDGTYVREE